MRRLPLQLRWTTLITTPRQHQGHLVTLDLELGPFLLL